MDNIASRVLMLHQTVTDFISDAFITKDQF